MNDNCKHEMVGTFPRVCMKCGMESFDFRASVYLEHAQRERSLFYANQVRRSAELKIYEEPSSEEAPKCKKRYRSIDDPWEV